MVLNVNLNTRVIEKAAGEFIFGGDTDVGVPDNLPIVPSL